MGVFAVPAILLLNKKLKEKKLTVYHRCPDVEVYEVIQVDFCRGDGTPESPFRKVLALYKKDGSFICELDNFKDQDHD